MATASVSSCTISAMPGSSLRNLSIQAISSPSRQSDCAYVAKTVTITLPSAQGGGISSIGALRFAKAHTHKYSEENPKGWKKHIPDSLMRAEHFEWAWDAE